MSWPPLCLPTYEKLAPPLFAGSNEVAPSIEQHFVNTGQRQLVHALYRMQEAGKNPCDLDL